MTRALLCGLAMLLTSAVLRAGTLAIESPWMREPAPGQGAAAIYLRLVNSGASARVVTGARVDGASSAAVHEHTMQDGMMRMRPAGALTIPAGGELKLEPGGYHLMVFGLAPAPAPGQQVPFCLQTAEGAELCAVAEVRGLGE